MSVAFDSVATVADRQPARSERSVWNVVQTLPHAESQVGKFLVAHGLDVYAPQFPVSAGTKPTSVRGRRYRYVFPSYLFVKTPMAFAAWDVVRWAPGVRRVLQQDGLPAVVADDVVDHLRQRLAQRALKPLRQKFGPGQRVVIESGPLRMLDAIFDRELNTTTRVQVLIELLGRPLKVEVDPATLRPAS